MDCPDWPRLAEWRQTDRPAPSGWSAALDHLAGCAACRERVAAWDPALLAAAAPPLEIDDQEVAAVRSAVRALRRAEAVGGRPPNRYPDRITGRLGGRGLAAAIVAAVALAVVLALPAALRRPASQQVAALPASAAGEAAELGGAPLIEPLQPSRARIYQFGSDDLPVVLIVDETLDF